MWTQLLEVLVTQLLRYLRFDDKLPACVARRCWPAMPTGDARARPPLSGCAPHKRLGARINAMKIDEAPGGIGAHLDDRVARAWRENTILA